MTNIPPPNGVVRMIKRLAAVAAMIFTFGLLGCAAAQIIPYPPYEVYVFLALLMGFLEPSFARELISIIKGSGK